MKEVPIERLPAQNMGFTIPRLEFRVFIDFVKGKLRIKKAREIRDNILKKFAERNSLVPPAEDFVRYEIEKAFGKKVKKVKVTKVPVMRKETTRSAY